MPAKVTFPGSAGSYVDTADTNLLDADTAHNHQASGLWSNNTNSTNRDRVTDQVLFGDGSFGWEASGATNSGVAETNTGTAAHPISSSTEYSVALGAWTDGPADDVRVFVTQYDGAGASLGNTVGTSKAAVLDGWAYPFVTWTSDGSAAFVSMTVQFLGSVVSGDLFRIDELILRAGSATTFVPSLRIVGDVDLRAKGSSDIWTGVRFLIDNFGSAVGYAMYFNADNLSLAIDTRSGATSTGITTDSAAHVWRVTFDESTGTITYYEDGSQIDTDSAATGAITPSAIGSAVGANDSGGQNWDGDLYYAEVRDGVDGPVVARFDAEDIVGVL